MNTHLLKAVRAHILAHPEGFDQTRTDRGIAFHICKSFEVKGLAELAYGGFGNPSLEHAAIEVLGMAGTPLYVFEDLFSWGPEDLDFREPGSIEHARFCAKKIDRFIAEHVAEAGTEA